MKHLVSANALKKQEALAALAEQYGCPWLEYDEQMAKPPEVLFEVDLQYLKTAGWMPLEVTAEEATVVACAPSPALAAEVRQTLGVDTVRFKVTLPADLIRIIEHNQDVNPGFPPAAGRTPLAKVRTYLAGRRSLFAHYRTLLAKSRTGLAFIRTGFSFITIAVLLFRLLGGGLMLFLEVPLLGVGLYLAASCIKSYMPARRVSTILPPCDVTEPTNGTTVLTVDDVYTLPTFARTPPVPGAALLRAGWTLLSPVMRRRFLASDRTDLAEERTVLACYRTRMAKVRTGLAFVRTGNAFIGFGFGLLRKFPSGSWHVFDTGLAVLGVLMVAEGFYWYFRGRPAGIKGHASVKHGNARATIWDFFFPHSLQPPEAGSSFWTRPLPVTATQVPGIWATTGVALERTLLAERRNVMARLRTTMARARTGFSFIRTGVSIFLVALVLAVYLPENNLPLAIIEGLMMLSGLFLVADGLYWAVPAERTRKQFPHCFGDMEIVFANYGIPCRSWRKAVFGRE
jgi:uncharacterized membrane protein YidH (DUF202 family)